MAVKQAVLSALKMDQSTSSLLKIIDDITEEVPLDNQLVSETSLTNQSKLALSLNKHEAGAISSQQTKSVVTIKVSAALLVNGSVSKLSIDNIEVSSDALIIDVKDQLVSLLLEDDGYEEWARAQRLSDVLSFRLHPHFTSSPSRKYYRLRSTNWQGETGKVIEEMDEDGVCRSIESVMISSECLLVHVEEGQIFVKGRSSVPVSPCTMFSIDNFDVLC